MNTRENGDVSGEKMRRCVESREVQKFLAV